MPPTHVQWRGYVCGLISLPPPLPLSCKTKLGFSRVPAKRNKKIRADEIVFFLNAMQCGNSRAVSTSQMENYTCNCAAAVSRILRGRDLTLIPFLFLRIWVGAEAMARGTS